MPYFKLGVFSDSCEMILAYGVYSAILTDQLNLSESNLASVKRIEKRVDSVCRICLGF